MVILGKHLEKMGGIITNLTIIQVPSLISSKLVYEAHTSSSEALPKLLLFILGTHFLSVDTMKSSSISLIPYTANGADCWSVIRGKFRPWTWTSIMLWVLHNCMWLTNNTAIMPKSLQQIIKLLKITTLIVPISACYYSELHSALLSYGHFTHDPRAVTMKLWEPKRKCPKAVLSHLQNHVVWSQTLKCSVKLYVTMPSTKCYYNEFLFMRILTHDTIE